METILDKNNDVYFEKSFNENQKEEIVKKVIEEINKQNTNPENNIRSISECSSYEKGFIMELTNVIKEAVMIENPEYSKYLKYHSMRSFRFIIQEEQVVGLRCKDNLRFWTTSEKMLLKKYVDLVLN